MAGTAHHYKAPVVNVRQTTKRFWKEPPPARAKRLSPNVAKAKHMLLVN